MLRQKAELHQHWQQCLEATLVKAAPVSKFDRRRGHSIERFKNIQLERNRNCGHFVKCEPRIPYRRVINHGQLILHNSPYCPKTVINNCTVSSIGREDECT